MESLQTVGIACRAAFIKSRRLIFIKKEKLAGLPVLANIDQAKPLSGLFRVVASAGFSVLTYTLTPSFH
jgi:hypothetical protein